MVASRGLGGGNENRTKKERELRVTEERVGEGEKLMAEKRDRERKERS